MREKQFLIHDVIDDREGLINSMRELFLQLQKKDLEKEVEPEQNKIFYKDKQKVMTSI